MEFTIRSSRCVPCGTSAANAASGIDKKSVHAAVLIASSSHDKMTHPRYRAATKRSGYKNGTDRALAFPSRDCKGAVRRPAPRCNPSLMSKKAFEQKLATLETLRADAASPQTVAALRKALQDPNNYYVSKAAAIAADFALTDLIPDLLAAFDRFLINPVKSDPQCWAKNAIAKALKDFAYDDA